MKTQTIKPASPLPWKVGGVAKRGKEDRAYIVHAANAYPALVEALEKIADATDPDGSQSKMLCELYEVARAALSAAKGSQP